MSRNASQTTLVQIKVFCFFVFGKVSGIRQSNKIAKEIYNCHSRGDILHLVLLSHSLLPAPVVLDEMTLATQFDINEGFVH